MDTRCFPPTDPWRTSEEHSTQERCARGCRWRHRRIRARRSRSRTGFGCDQYQGGNRGDQRHGDDPVGSSLWRLRQERLERHRNQDLPGSAAVPRRPRGWRSGLRLRAVDRHHQCVRQRGHGPQGRGSSRRLPGRLTDGGQEERGGCRQARRHGRVRQPHRWRQPLEGSGRQDGLSAGSRNPRRGHDLTGRQG